MYVLVIFKLIFVKVAEHLKFILMVEHHDAYMFIYIIHTKNNFTYRSYLWYKIKHNHVSIKLGLFSYFEIFV